MPSSMTAPSFHLTAVSLLTFSTVVLQIGPWEPCPLPSLALWKLCVPAAEGHSSLMPAGCRLGFGTCCARKAWHGGILPTAFSLLTFSAAGLQIGPWEPWLARGMESPDCKLSSHAARAWLHLQAARAAAAAAASPQVRRLASPRARGLCCVPVD